MAFLTGQSWRVHLFTGGGPKQGLNESLVSSVAQFSPSLFKTTQCWGSCSVRSFLLVVFVCLFFVLFVSFGATSFVSAPLRWSFLNSYPYWCRFACYWKYRVFVVFAFLVLLLSFFPLGARESVPGTGTKWCFVDTLSTRYVHIVNSPCQTPFGNMTLATSTKQWTAPILIKLKQGAHKDPVPTSVACARKQGLDLVRTWVPSTANAALDK